MCVCNVHTLQSSQPQPASSSNAMQGPHTHNQDRDSTEPRQHITAGYLHWMPTHTVPRPKQLALTSPQQLRGAGRETSKAHLARLCLGSNGELQLPTLRLGYASQCR